MINAQLARAAAERGLGMVLGSGRPLLRDPGLLPTYRSSARPPLRLANLGGVGLTTESAVRLVDLLGADGLSVHLNPVQEAVQPKGEPRFADVRERIAAVVRALAPLPVVVKEVGFGMDAEDVRELAALGVAAIDVAGSGGTHWALVEAPATRVPRGGRRVRRLGVGLPTPCGRPRWWPPRFRCWPAVASAMGSTSLAAWRSVRGFGIARPLLIAAEEERAAEALDVVLRQLQIAVWASGAPSAAAMGAEQLA